MSGRERQPSHTAVRFIPALLLLVTACGCTPAVHYFHQHTPACLLDGDQSAYYQCGRCGKVVNRGCDDEHGCSPEPPFLGFPVTRWHVLPCEPQSEPSIPVHDAPAPEAIPSQPVLTTPRPSEPRGTVPRLPAPTDGTQDTGGQLPVLPPATAGSHQFPAATGNWGLGNLALGPWSIENGPAPRLPAGLPGAESASAYGPARSLADPRYRQYPFDTGSWSLPNVAALPIASRQPDDTSSADGGWRCATHLSRSVGICSRESGVKSTDVSLRQFGIQ